MSKPTLVSIRTADFAGKISWKTHQKCEVKLNNTYYILLVQRPKWFAIVEKVIYKKWRVVMRKKKHSRAARVVAECDTKREVMKSLNEIKNLFRTGFAKKVSALEVLRHGDIISVPTKMVPGGGARHFGVYDQTNNRVIEYQPDNRTIKGSIQSTPFGAFCARVKATFKGKLDLRKHEYIKSSGKWFGSYEVVRRATKCIGISNYNAVFKNCETFAVWCKTGKKQSIQSIEYMEIVYDNGIKIAIGAAAIVLVIGITVAVVTSGGAAAAPIASAGSAGAELTVASTTASSIGTAATTMATNLGIGSATTATIGTVTTNVASTAITTASTVGTTAMTTASTIGTNAMVTGSTIAATGSISSCTALGGASCTAVGTTVVGSVAGAAGLGSLAVHNIISTNTSCFQ